MARLTDTQGVRRQGVVMTRRLRLLLLACASVAGLAFAGGAFAAFTPQLAVSNNPMATGNNSGATIVRVTVPNADDALFRADIYVPTGFEAPLAQNAGAQIGTVAARVLVREPVAGAVVPLNGTVTTENPASHTTSPCAPGLHAAVWMITLQAPTGPLNVPVYVDRTSGAEANLGAYRLRVCLPSPHIPQSAGGAALGAKLVRAELRLNQVFRTPTAAGEYLFRVIATPWAAPAIPNAAATVEARATIGIPAGVSIAASTRRRVLTVTGRLTEGAAGVSRGTVVVRIGRRAHTVRTNATGRYAVRVRFRSAARPTVRATGTAPVRTETCTGPSPAPAGCVSHTRAFFAVTSRTLRPRVR
jgi:hypothetical protein